jgi:competence CoiA-like predicted nuclease|tara:strand:- start:82 stop:273 length:192 start_codon:yes stop_codon:yes gene_type:complete
MDKQSYKRILADEMAKTSELRDKINQIKSLIENNSNDMELGKKIRTMYWDNKKNNNQLGLFNE